MAYTSADIQGYLAANPGMSDVQIASAMNQYGVTPEQMAAATGIGMPEVQTRYSNAMEQLVGVPPREREPGFPKQELTPGLGIPSEQLVGGPPRQHEPGFQGLTPLQREPGFPVQGYPRDTTYGTQGISGDVISNYIAANLQNPELIAQKAKEFGLSALDIQRAAGYSPEQQARYLSYAGITPTGIAGLTPMSYGDKGQFTAKDVIDYVNQYTYDPTRIYQAAQRYAITPEQIQSLFAGSSTPYDLQQIKNYFDTGKAGLGTRIQDIIASTIGGVNTAPTVESLFQNILGRTPTQSELDFWQQKFGPEIDQNEIDIAVQAAQAEKAGAKYDKPLTTADLIGLIEGSLSPSTTKLSSFTPESLSKKSIEEIEELIAQSPTNRLQEAGRVSGLAQRLYGTSKEDATKLASDLFAGKDTDDFAEGIYKDLLTKGFTKDVQNEVFLNAAKTNPNSQFFKDNPDLLLAYSPLKEKTGTTGQYDYINNAPLLNAAFGEQKLGNKNQVVLDLDNDTTFGWTTKSKYAGTLMRGPAILGVEFNNSEDIEKAIALEQGIKNGTLVQDEEGRYYNTSTGETFTVPTSDNARKAYNPYSSNTLTTLQDAARKAGLDPSIYRSAGALYDALEDKTKNIYQVIGRATDWDPEAAKNLGITQTTGGRGGVNHVSARYERIGDKLVPIAAKAFEYHDPNTSRGFIGDLAMDIAQVPFIAEIATAASGGNPMVYAALKGAQTMALGGDLDDALKSAGIAYLTSGVIPKYVTPQVSLALAQNPLVSQLANAGGDKFANFIIDGGTRAIISSGLAAIAGQDPGKAALNALAQSGIGTLTREGLQLTNIPNEYRSIVSNILSSAVLGQDPTKALTGSLTGSVTRILKEELQDFNKETVKSDQDKTTKETKI